MKKYKCIGLKETVIKDWEQDFTIGKTYKECTEPHTYVAKNELFLIGNDEDNLLGWFVDKDQFEEVL